MSRRIGPNLKIVLYCMAIVVLAIFGMIVAERLGEQARSAPAQAAVSPQTVDCEEAMNNALAAARAADRASWTAPMTARSLRSLAWSAIYDGVCR